MDTNKEVLSIQCPKCSTVTMVKDPSVKTKCGNCGFRITGRDYKSRMRKELLFMSVSLIIIGIYLLYESSFTDIIKTISGMVVIIIGIISAFWFRDFIRKNTAGK
jgi:ribosomal protein S27AE